MGELKVRKLNLDLPAGWTDTSILSAIAPGGGTFRKNLVVTSEAREGRSLPDYIQGHLAALRGEFADLAIARNEPGRYGALEGVVLEQNLTVEGGLKLTQLQFLFVQGEDVFAATLTGPTAELPELRKSFETIVATLRFDA